MQKIGDEYNTPAGEYSTSASYQPQPIMMQPLGQNQQIHPTGMQPMGGAPMVGQPVMGTPMGQPYGQPMMMQPMAMTLEWDKPRVCAECTGECCLAFCCPCISVHQISVLAKMPTGMWALAVAVLVFLQYVTDSVQKIPVEGNDPALRAVMGAASLVNLVCDVMEAVVLMKWKHAIGQWIKVRNPMENGCEDFMCMCCCYCYAISAVQRTVEAANRMGGGAGGGPGVVGPPIMMVQAPGAPAVPAQQQQQFQEVH